MNKEKVAKGIIEDILGHPIQNDTFIGVKNKRNDDSDYIKKQKSEITKFSELPPQVEKNILSFLDVDRDKKDLLKYGMINKTKFNNFNYNTNVSYGKLLIQTIIYDAKDISRYFENDKLKLDTENIINLRWDKKTLGYDDFIKILEKKSKNKNQLLSLEIRSLASVYVNISSMFEYIKNLNELKIYGGFHIERNSFKFNNLKNIKLEFCWMESWDDLKLLKNLEYLNLNVDRLISNEINFYLILKEISTNNTLKIFKSLNYDLNNGGFEFLQNLETLKCFYDPNLQLNGQLKYLSNLKKLSVLIESKIEILNYDYKTFPIYFNKLDILKIHFFIGPSLIDDISKKFTKIIGKFTKLTKYKQREGNLNTQSFSGLINLKELDLRNVNLISNDFRNITNFYPDKIKKLYINDTNAILLGFTNLNSLTIYNRLDMNDNDIIPILIPIKNITISFGTRLTDAIFANMYNVKTLRIYDCPVFTTNGIIYLLKNSPNLTYLKLHGNDMVSNEIFSYVDTLSILDLSSFGNIKIYNIENVAKLRESKIDIYIDSNKIYF
jgi:hypothetical protein